MIDLHCHILHGIDDGARSIDEAVHLCHIAVQNSIDTAVVTPHLVHPEKVDEFVRVRDRRIAELREKLEKLPDDMDVWSKIADQPIDEVYEQTHCDCGEWKTVIMLE